MSRLVGFEGQHVELLHHPYQIAALKALRARFAVPIDFALNPAPILGLDGRPLPRLTDDNQPLIYDVSQIHPDHVKRAKRAWRYIMLRAGRRGGKTRFGGLAVAEQAAIPYSIIYAAAPTFAKLHEVVWPSIFAAIPRDWILPKEQGGWNENYQLLRLINGTIIYGRSMEDPGWCRGPGPDLVWMDELCMTSEDGWKATEPALADRQGVTIVTTTPNGPDWVDRTFYQAAVNGIPGYWAVQYRSTANPKFTEEEYQRLKATTDPDWFRQEYDADIVVFTGAIFADLLPKQVLRGVEDHRRHFPEWPRIDPDRLSLVALDPGAQHPFGGLLLVQGDLGLVAIGEYRESNRTNRVHAAELSTFREYRCSNEERLIIGWKCDPSQRQSMIELQSYGIPATPSDNDVFGGIMRVRSWMHAGDLWISADCCPKLYAEMLEYRWKETKNPNTGEVRREEPLKIKDDLCDPLRYACLSWPGMPRAIGQEAVAPTRKRRVIPAEVEWTIARLRRIADAQNAEAEGLINVTEYPQMFSDLYQVPADQPYLDWYN